jgi:ATP-binding cassette subfamily C protein CydC
MFKRIRELLPYIRMILPHWKQAAAGTLFGLITIAATVGLLALSGWFLAATAFAGLTAATAGMFNYFLPSVGVRIFAIARTLCRYAERIISHEATFRLLESLRSWFYRQLEPLAPARLMQYRSGDILNRIIADIDALDNLYLRVVSPTIVAILLAFITLGFLWFFDPFLAIVTFTCLLGAGFSVPAVAGALGAEAGRKLAGHTATLRIQIVEGIQGLSELLVFGRQRDYLDRIRQENRELLKVQRHMSRVRGFSSAIITIVAGFAVIAALYRGAFLVNVGELYGANLALVALTVLVAFDAVMPLPSAYQYLGRTREAGRRMLEIVDAQPVVWFPARSTAQPRQFDLAFDGVSFRYRSEDPPAVADVDFTVKHGERVAILGETGAGKSTLAHLLVRFWDPDDGCISLGGEDIRNFSEADIRRFTTVVSQQAHMFSASIRDNLLLGRPGADEEELWSALKAAELLEFVQTLPRGLDTWIGEAGKLISGGQARRLAVARAILHDAPLWLLDEPTEGLDRSAEQRVMQTLFEITRDRTLLLITHRLVALDRVDRILILEKGRIVEQGTHAQLLEGDTRYSALQARIRL